MSQSVVQVSETPQVETSQKITFEQYKFYQFEREGDVVYELYRGQLIPMATATVLHIKICEFLVYKLQRYLTSQNLNLVAKTSLGVRTEDDSSRIPDVIVCTESLLEQAATRPGAGILDLNETPLLVVEVVSENRRRDYVIKRAEYEQAGVPGYWILDPTPNKQRIRVLTGGETQEGYNQIDFLPGQEMVSIQFPNLVLSVDEVLAPPVVETLIKEEQARLQQADRLAARLREMGIDPNSI